MISPKQKRMYRKKTHSKFELWDSLSAERKVKLMPDYYKDPTYFAYGMLKDKDRNPMKLYWYQDLVINDKGSHVILCSGRQIGKTQMLCVKALHHAIMVPNSTVLLVSRSESQAVMILDEIKEMLMRADLDFERVLGEVQNRMELHINSGEKSISKIICLPPTHRGRGFSATLLLLDEVAYWEAENKDEDQEKLYYSIFEPTTSATKDRKHPFLTMGQIVACSTPNGQQGIFWSLWNNSDFSQYHFNWLVKPGRNDEEFLKKKGQMAIMVWESEYAALFVSSAGGWITQEEFERNIKNYPIILPGGDIICLGCDFAGEDTLSREVDYTVMYGVQTFRESENGPLKIKIVFQKEYPKKILKERIYNDLLAMKERIAKFAYDKVGVGDSVKNDLIEKNVLSEWQIEALTYSLPNKSEVYYNLKHIFEQNRIEISEDVYPELKKQLLGLKFELTKGGHLGQMNVKIHHKSGFHDDHADAFANACYAALRLGMGEVSITKIEMPIGKPKAVEFPEPRKISSNLVECDHCTGNWEYNGEKECIYCKADKTHIGYYVDGKRV